MLPGVDLESLIEAVGIIGVAFIVFAESGLLVGFFLPGDSLLFTAGFLASQDVVSIWLLVPVSFVAAVAGDAVGYQFGHRVGRRLFEREDSRFFKRQYLERAEAFFAEHGGKAIILARFIPIVRTFTPIVAGISIMPYRQFAVYNFIGGALWAAGITLLGYFLGSSIPGIDKYLLPIIAVIILVSVLPPALHLLREQRKSNAASKPETLS